jgi:hypothetical protein
LGVAVGGAYFQRRSSGGPNLAAPDSGTAILYASLIVMEWALVWYGWGGIDGEGASIARSDRRKMEQLEKCALDVVVALPFWRLWDGVAGLIHLVTGETHAKGVQSLLPQS